MKRNVGATDRLVRIVIGVLLVGGNLVNYYLFKNPYCPWANIGWIPLLSGLLGWCPTYTLFRKPRAKE